MCGSGDGAQLPTAPCHAEAAPAAAPQTAARYGLAAGRMPGQLYGSVSDRLPARSGPSPSGDDDMRMLRGLFIFALGAASVLVTAGALQQQQQSDVQFIGNGRLLSNAVRVGNTLYLSGVLGTSGERGITPETRAVMERIKTLLEANGSQMDDIIKCTVYLADFSEWGAMNTVYLEYFQKHRPARSAVAVNGMASDARVEIECMAVIGARNAT
jgi:2-iminobutanoate/2-iminopropanoate deaminase